MYTIRPRTTDSTNDNTTTFRLYYYQPSLAAAILFTILFTLTTTLHSIQLLRTKTWFMVPFITGGLFEISGYVARSVSASANPGPYALGPFIIQSVLTLVAPALFAASLYMELGRIALMIDAQAALIVRRRWLTKMFVCGDVVSFVVQAGGAGLLSTSDQAVARDGKFIVAAGLVLQIVFFGLFVSAVAVFHSRVVRAPTKLAAERPWKKHVRSLYLVSGMIFVRSIVRTVEYVQGYRGFVYGHEAFLYVFDAVVMVAAMGVMSLVHPGEVARFIRKDREENEKGGGIDVAV